MHWTWTKGENYASAMLSPPVVFFPRPLFILILHSLPFFMYLSLSLGWTIRRKKINNWKWLQMDKYLCKYTEYTLINNILNVYIRGKKQNDTRSLALGTVKARHMYYTNMRLFSFCLWLVFFVSFFIFTFVPVATISYQFKLDCCVLMVALR